MWPSESALPLDQDFAVSNLRLQSYSAESKNYVENSHSIRFGGHSPRGTSSNLGQISSTTGFLLTSLSNAVESAATNVADGRTLDVRNDSLSVNHLVAAGGWL